MRVASVAFDDRRAPAVVSGDQVAVSEILIAGILLTLTAIKQPEGVTATPPPPLVKLGRRIEAAWRVRRPSRAPPSTQPGG